jgi:hypothetical protein
MKNNQNITSVPYYGELVNLLTEVYFSLNGEKPLLKDKIKHTLEAAAPEKLYEKYPEHS